ncbi:MAG: signal recognition particle subunit SRP19/SEC65 family protein [Candidatus Methanofastidiosia archaeon]
MKSVIWLANLDSSLKRSEGRKVPQGLAISEISFKELKRALENLGLKFEAEMREYPKHQGFEKRISGRVMVEKKYSKSKLLKVICDEIRKMRADET